MPGTETSPFMEIDGTRVRVLTTAPAVAVDAAPVFVLHGWGASLQAIATITGGLKDRVEIVALDFPGFGESPDPPAEWAVGDYARLVLALADRLEIQRFSVVGHSFGGRVAIVLADEHPERIARVLLTGAAGIKPRRKPSYYGRVAIAKLGRVIGAVGGPPGRRLQERMRKRVASADWLAASGTMRGTFRRVIDEDLTPRLEAIKAPTLLIWGEHDTETPLWMGKLMEQRIPDAGLVVLDGGHYAYAERAGEFNRIAAHFLGDQPATAGR